MALLLTDGSLYLHIPKTGGNWLTDILARLDLVSESVGHKHATYGYVAGAFSRRRQGLMQRTARKLKLTRRHVDPSAIFCVVRHPLRWYESWYRYQSSREWRDWGQTGSLRKWHPCMELNGCDTTTFGAFMADVNAKAPGFATRLYLRYTAESGATVLKNERLAEDLVTFLDGRGIVLDPDLVRRAPRLGESPKLPIQWPKDVLRETMALEATGLRYFGYDPI